MYVGLCYQKLKQTDLKDVPSTAINDQLLAFSHLCPKESCSWTSATNSIIAQNGMLPPDLGVYMRRYVTCCFFTCTLICKMLCDLYYILLTTTEGGSEGGHYYAHCTDRRTEADKSNFSKAIPLNLIKGSPRPKHKPSYPEGLPTRLVH